MLKFKGDVREWYSYAFSAIYRTSSFKLAYENEGIIPPIIGDLVAEDDSTIQRLPPLWYATTGRPKKKRRRKRNENATGDTMVWESGNSINGYEVGVSNQVEINQAIFGDFRQIVLGFWDGLSLTVDPYTESGEGSIRITARQIVDVAVLRPESFAIANITLWSQGG